MSVIIYDIFLLSDWWQNWDGHKFSCNESGPTAGQINVWYIKFCTSTYRPGNQRVWNDTRAVKIWILHTEFLNIVIIWVFNFFSVWHLANPGWLKGEILGSNGTITLPVIPSQLSRYCVFACYSICCSEGFPKCRQTSSDHPY